MRAVALCVGLFAYWTIVGYAVVTWLRAGRSGVQDLLLSPAVGLAATVVPLLSLSRLGLPVRTFGIPLGVVLLAGSALLLWWNRPAVPWRRAWPFAAALALALAATGRPMAKFGFNWVSFCNDDMANYALAAQRFYDHGYFDEPKPEEYIRGRYYPGDFWFMYVAMRARPGCELTLAWARSVTRLGEHQLFMPLAMSYHLGLVLAVGALVVPVTPWSRSSFLNRRGRKSARSPARDEPNSDPTLSDENAPGFGATLRQAQSPAWPTCAMLAVSALVSLGTLYQLIAQVAGLMLLAACAAMLLRPLGSLTPGHRARQGVLLGLLGAGLLVVYPEVIPFLGLAWAAYLVVGLVRRQVALAPALVLVTIAMLVAIVLTRRYFFDSVTYVFNQATSATSQKSAVHTADPQATQFPYYMLPEGLADFWGFMRLAKWEEDPYQSIVIALGGVLLVTAFAAALWLCCRGQPVGFVAVGMFVLVVVLFRQRAGFGLYKLAMYLQPFAAATLVTAWLALLRRRRLSVPWAIVRLAPLAALAVAGYSAQAEYVASSYGIGSAFLEISNPSKGRVAAEFRDVVLAHPSEPVIVSDTYNIVLAKFQSLYAPGRELVFPSGPFFHVVDLAAETGWKYLDPERARFADDLYQARKNTVMVRTEFDLHDAAHPGATNAFHQTDQGRTAAGADGGALLVATTPRQTIFNRRHFSPGLKSSYAAMPFSEAHDHLIYVVSELGVPYYIHRGRDLRPALYQLEYDPLFFEGDTMAAVGQYLLLQVINPSEQVRLMVNLTCSYQADGQNVLPPMELVGAERLKFPIAGRGSMRVFSPPIVPQDIGGRKYLLLDMGTPGRRFGDRRTGLMKWYGRDIPIDRRVVVGFARDVSAVSEAEYQKLVPPSQLSGFPMAQQCKANPLRGQDLEYYGLYEDGWVGEDAQVRLTQPAGAGAIIVKGMVDANLVPGGAHAAQVILSIDGQVVQQATIGLGEFTIQGEVTPPAGQGAVRTIRLQFAGPLLHLPDPDNRPVAAQLLSVGFEKPVATVHKP